MGKPNPECCEHVTHKGKGALVISASGDVYPVFPRNGVHCHLVADPGHKYCPRHELEHAKDTETRDGE